MSNATGPTSRRAFPRRSLLAVAEVGPWWWGLALTVTFCLGLYLVNVAFWEVRPRTVLGMSYGIAAAALLVVSALYSARRRVMSAASRWRLGSAST